MKLFVASRYALRFQLEQRISTGKSREYVSRLFRIQYLARINEKIELGSTCSLTCCNNRVCIWQKKRTSRIRIGYIIGTAASIDETSFRDAPCHLLISPLSFSCFSQYNDNICIAGRTQLLDLPWCGDAHPSPSFTPSRLRCSCARYPISVAGIFIRRF